MNNFSRLQKGFFLALPLLTFVAAMLLLSGCRKDLGNYSYNRVDTLVFGNFQGPYNVQLGVSPGIKPALTFKQGTPFVDSNYTYEWVCYNNSVASASERRSTLHRGKNLDVVLNLGVGTYSCYYVVTDKANGVTWQKAFILTISGSIKKAGWFVLNEIDSVSRLDYYEEDQANWGSFPTIYKNLPSLIKDQTNPALSLELTGKPVSIETFTNRDPVNTANKYWLYINTTHTTEKINITDGFIWNKVKYLFANETVIGEPKRAEVLLPTGSGTSYAYADGNLYLYNYATLLYYGTPLNKIGATGVTFKIAPYFASPATANMHNIFFDTDNRRFVRTSNSSSGASIISTPTQAFDLQYVAKDLVWLGFTRALNGQAVAILKDGGQYYLARIAFGYTTSSPTITATSIENITTALTGIANADRFVLDQQYGYLFYTVGSKLYQYDMDNKILKEAYDFGTRKISMLKVNRLMTVYTNTGRFAAPGYAIIVGTYDVAAPNTTGQVDFFKAPELLGTLSRYQESFTGLGRVVDVKYSELSN